jgi:hypothetical protein
LHALFLLMKALLQTPPQQAGRAEIPGARPGAPNADKKASAIPQRPGESMPPLQVADEAGGASANLAIELGEFISRIPPRLLKHSGFDPHRPVLFDIGAIADRIARGAFMIPVEELIKVAPEIFVDVAPAQRALEVRFPWQRVEELLHESAALEKEHGGETLAQKLRRHRHKNVPGSPAPAQDAPIAESEKEKAGRDHQGGAAVEAPNDRGNVAQDKAALERAAAILKVREVPDSAPALFELPETKAANLSTPAPAPAAPARPELAIATPTPQPKPISDLMDLSLAPTPAPPNPARPERPIATPAPQSKPISDLMGLRLAPAAPAEEAGARAGKREIAPAPPVIPAKSSPPQMEPAKKNTNGIRPAPPETAPARAQSDIVREPAGAAEMEARLAALTAERDAALSKSRHTQKEVEQVIAQAAAMRAELEMRKQGAAQFDEDIAQYRVRIKAVLAERSALARTVEEARLEHASALDDAKQALVTATAERDAAQAARQRAEAFGEAQAAAHERAVAQWEADVENYRKRLQLVIGERTTLEAKLRLAESALPAAGGAVIGTAA